MRLCAAVGGDTRLGVPYVISRDSSDSEAYLAEILGVARKRRAHRVAVFGSVARGEARPDSDLDLLVDFEPGASLLDHVGLFQDLEELLGVGVGVVTRSALKPRDEHIRIEAVDL